MEKLIQILKSLGLTGNESRIYLSLLMVYPATGYEISRSTSVPRSAIYNALEKLEAQNLVNCVGNRPKKFIPIAPSALVDHYAHKIDHNLAELKAGLIALKPEEQNLNVWFLKGYEDMIMKAKELITNAQETVYLSLLETEYAALGNEILAAIKRGVGITIFSFTKIPEIKAHVVSYELEEQEIRKAWKPTIIVVSDHKSAIMGGASKSSANHVVWTDHPSIMSIATNHIILDITLTGMRLNRDVNAIVAPMMDGLRADLGNLLDEAHPHIHFSKSTVAKQTELE
ncbi:TrmB family transcriptional regulator [Candidatus Neomarinimicrobiota bacterium]